MKAAVWKEIGSALSIENVAAPDMVPGEAVVDVLATPVLSYTDRVLSGERAYLAELPMIPGPGAVARVRALPPDATRLRLGDLVYCDSTIRARDDADCPDMILQGWTARGPGGLQLQRYFKHGAFAERMRLPIENVTGLGNIDVTDAGRWCALGALLVPFGGLLAGGVQAGETIVVNGATGNFGSAAVAVALGMGASRVIATGRNATVLAGLVERFGTRVTPVTMTGQTSEDTAAIVAAAGRSADLVFDILPPMASAAQVLAAVLATRPNGRVVLMGGVRNNLAIPYDWMMRNNITIYGQWMYPRAAVRRMVSLVRAGQITLDHFAVTEFPLEDANAAVAHASSHAGPFAMTVLRPNVDTGSR